MSTDVKTRLEETFLSLPGDERGSIITLGVTLKLSYLRKRLFLAQSKLQQFEEQYDVSLEQLDSEGLPDDAGYLMHEDFIMWHHWSEVADKVRQEIAALENVAAEGLYLQASSYAGG